MIPLLCYKSLLIKLDALPKYCSLTSFQGLEKGHAVFLSTGYMQVCERGTFLSEWHTKGSGIRPQGRASQDKSYRVPATSSFTWFCRYCPLTAGTVHILTKRCLPLLLFKFWLCSCLNLIPAKQRSQDFSKGRGHIVSK